MRTLKTDKYTKVNVIDEPSFGGACHNYEIVSKKEHPEFKEPCFRDCISFQKGPIKEHGVNGIHNEDLIAIVIDRMEGFQSGDYECSENQTALQHLRDALEALNDRTAAREKRGVEGTHTI